MLLTTIILSLREIRRHMLRSFLTVLGVVIGVAAVVTMVTLGNAATKSVQSQISSLGSNLLTLIPGQGFGRGGGAAPQPFKPEDIEAIRTQVAGVVAVAPQAQANVTAIRNSANWSVAVNGTTNDFLVGQNWAVVEGRQFSAAEQDAGKSVCLIGNTVRTNLYRTEAPLGTRLRLGSISCEVIGILATRGQGGFQDQDNTVLMPFKAVQRRLTGTRNVNLITVAIDPKYESKAIQQSLQALMRERRKIGADKEDDFNVFDSKQISDTLSGATNTLTSIVTAVAAISLLVGGIGIMNIMLVSVTERTREIGIRLAIGAVAREVLLQFLVEAVVLSCLGGLIGLMLSFVGITAITVAMHLPFLFLPHVNLMAFAVSALIGVIFGYFPAKRAASLNPIDALRHE